MRPQFVTALMPCLNEERTLGTCIEKAQACLRSLGLDGEVVVADNGSSDRSIEIAQRLGARVVHQSTRGYGAALRAGIEAARGDVIVMADADDSYDWLDMGRFIEKIAQGFDLVMGNRFQGGIARNAMPALHRYLGNPVLSTLARVIHRAPVGDFHCGMRAFTKAAYGRMKLRAPGMEFATEMVVNSARAGLRIAEVPTALRRDGRDRPPHLRSFRDGWRHLRFIFTYAPNYLYLGPGAALMLSGLALVAALSRGPITLAGQYVGIHFLALGCLLTLTGFNVINLGILAKVIAHSQMPHLNSRVSDWALQSFTLEGGLIAGVVLFIAGTATDSYILWEWLRSGSEQEATVHTAFVATLLIVLGLNIVFSSFLLNMFAIERRDRSS
ncbi:MAG TPA: glycosyltransferase family 2 protein [Steroidobacteraceae bacterium]|nr:glycosyltransferase family 2 protein [Steroidobacteraceae bacterium]